MRHAPPSVIVPEAGPMWERQKGEPNRWYALFHRFLELGPSRTLQAVYAEDWRARHPEAPENRKAPFPSGYWLEMARDWKWRERAEAYDQHLRLRDLAATEEARRAARERRIARLDLVEGFALKVITRPGADGEVRPAEAAQILIRVQEEKRKEMDDEPKRRHVHQHGGDPDNPIKHKVYLVPPGQPDPTEDL